MATKAADREPKRAPLNMRTTQTLRDRLAAEAAKNDRSLAQEVEARLEASFLVADLYAMVRSALSDDREAERERFRAAMGGYGRDVTMGQRLASQKIGLYGTNANLQKGSA
jgi:hypothetical protein